MTQDGTEDMNSLKIVGDFFFFSFWIMTHILSYNQNWNILPNISLFGCMPVDEWNSSFSFGKQKQQGLLRKKNYFSSCSLCVCILRFQFTAFVDLMWHFFVVVVVEKLSINLSTYLSWENKWIAKINWIHNLNLSHVCSRFVHVCECGG